MNDYEVMHIMAGSTLAAFVVISLTMLCFLMILGGVWYAIVGDFDKIENIPVALLMVDFGLSLFYGIYRVFQAVAG